MPTFDSTHFYSVLLGCASPRTTKPILAGGARKGCREKEAICPQTVPVINIQHHSPETGVLPVAVGNPRLCQSRAYLCYVSEMKYST